jgi:group I intron endonuclease
MEKIKCIYSIICTKNNKKYIGSTVDFNRRKRVHMCNLKNNKHHSYKLQNSFNKYGSDSFIFEILEIINSNEDLLIKEQNYLDELKPELNVVMVAGLNSHIGVRRTDETKEKIRIANTGKKASPETLEKMRIAVTGTKQSKETIYKRIKNQYKPIVEIKEDGSRIDWGSATDAANALSIDRKSIYRCLWGERKTYKKSRWLYKD